MSFGGGAPGYNAIVALIAARGDLSGVADKDWAAAAGLIVKKVLVAAGQTTASLIALRAACGDEIFDVQLRSLSHHQAKQLAKRLDKSAPDLEVSTARAAIAYIRTLLIPPPVAEPEPEAVTEDSTESPTDLAADPSTDEPVVETVTDGDDTPPSPPAAPNPYFGRKSFRTG